MRLWFICYGSSRTWFFTEYHAEQFARALRLNGTGYVMDWVEVTHA